MKKKILYLLIAVLAVLASGYFYFAWQKHPDTVLVKADYTVELLPFLQEFETDSKAANEKYADRIVEITGKVSETENADSTINIKMENQTTGSYVIFAFQDQHTDDAKTVSPGETVSIKGSCSGGIYSTILGLHAITFKRSALVK